MPFKPQNFSLILINGTLTLTSKIEDFWGSTSNKIFEEFSKNLEKIIKNSLKIALKFKVFRGFSKNLKNNDLILTSKFEGFRG